MKPRIFWRDRFSLITRQLLFEPKTLLELKFDQFLIAIFFFFSLIANFPGTFSPDSLVMYWQADRRVPLTDWHSPLFQEFWRFLSIGGREPRMIFLFQLITFTLALKFFLNLTSRYALKILILLLFLSPATQNILQYIGKDPFLFSFVFLIAFLLYKNKPLLIILYLPLFVLTASIRGNAIFLCIPILYSLATILLKRFGFPVFPVRAAIIRIAVTIILILLFFFSSFFLNKSISERGLNPQNTLLGWDLVGISVNEGQNLVPAEFLKANCSFELLKSQYSSVRSDQLIFFDNSCLRVMLPEDYQKQKELFDSHGLYSKAIPIRYFVSTVIEHPLSYLKHKAEVTKSLFGFRGDYQYLLMDKSSPRAIEIGIDSSSYSNIHSWYYKKVSESRLLRMMLHPLLWLFFFIAATTLPGPNRKTRILLLFSGLSYLCSLVVLLPGTDLRYLFPILALSLSSFALMLESTKNL